MRLLLVVLLILSSSQLGKAQCTDYTTNGFDAGNLTFNTGPCDYQTVAVDAQDYFTINVISGYDYHFDFCGNGGNPGGLYPNMSILNGTTLITSDLWDGTCTSISWTANITGAITLYITDDWDGCAGAAGAWSGTMAYNEDDGSANASFTLSSIICSGATATITGETGGNFAFNPVPGDGAIINSSTGEITNGVSGSTYSVDYTVCGITSNESVTLVSGADASFTLSSTNCFEANATITGDTGGSFSFNPAPIDGALINSSSGEITNGVSGSTYTVDYTVCGVTSNESITIFSNGDASFSLNASCGGAVPIVSGDQGGTFSFNPAPGDGAQVSSSTGIVSNATAGNTYYVEYTVCGASTTESVTVIDDDCFTLNGDAQYINVNGEQCIQLTDEANDLTGCAWNGNQIDFNSDFSLSLDYYFGTGANNGADGNTFTFQPSSSSACGSPGGQLGAGGISNALVIEFDTYDNDNPTHLYDMSCDHIAVETDGSMQFAAPYAGPVCAKPSGGNIDDGGTYSVEITWDASTQQLEIYFDGDLRLSCTGDFVNTVFGGQNEVYWGATSATGGLYNQQYFCPSTVVVLPVELNSFYSECTEEREVFYWESESEINLESYDLEYTYNGIVFYPVKSVEAVGTTDQKTQYSVSVESNDQKTRYYRLKMRDIDGRVETSELIASKSCHQNEGGIIHTVAQTSNEITINLKEIGELKVFDAFGKMVYISSNQLVHHIDTHEFSNGIYVIKVIDAEGSIRDTRKLMQAH